MAQRVVCKDDPEFRPRLVCGVDVSYDGDMAFVAATVWDAEHEQFVESVGANDKAAIPYVPGLLGFREGPLLFRIARRMKSLPDVFLVDGQGVAHPRRCGLACQFGLAVKKPTVGVAKSLLYGRPESGTILDPAGRIIARMISTANRRKFYVSVGHRISLDTASRLVERCLVDGHPAPLRRAHLDSMRVKRSLAD